MKSSTPESRTVDQNEHCVAPLIKAPRNQAQEEVKPIKLNEWVEKLKIYGYILPARKLLDDNEKAADGRTDTRLNIYLRF